MTQLLTVIVASPGPGPRPELEAAQGPDEALRSAVVAATISTVTDSQSRRSLGLKAAAAGGCGDPAARRRPRPPLRASDQA